MGLCGPEREEKTMYESPYQEAETEDLIAQVNELRSLLAMCWRLLPDGDYGPDAVAVKQGLSRFDCWPEALERIADTQARRRLSR